MSHLKEQFSPLVVGRTLWRARISSPGVQVVWDRDASQKHAGIARNLSRLLVLQDLLTGGLQNSALRGVYKPFQIWFPSLYCSKIVLEFEHSDS